MIKLSILICSCTDRINSQRFRRLISSLESQKTDEIEILILTDNKKRTIGAKRNDLVKLAKGEYVCFIDDDDRIVHDYINSLLNSMQSEPDIIVFQVIYNNGKKQRFVKYDARFEEEREFDGCYERWPNHLMCVKREIAIKTPFEDVSFGEDFHYAKKIVDEITTQAILSKVLYFYDDCKKTMINKKNIDVIILSYSKTKELYEMTKAMVKSLTENNPEFNFSINIVQTINNKFGDKYYFGDKNINVIYPNIPFHYNNYLTIAYNQMEHTSDKVLICNDDISFSENSILYLVKGMDEYMITSPLNPTSKYNSGKQSQYIGKSDYIEGYNTSEHFSGWCHLINKLIFNIIPIDIFWTKELGGFFQDNWICHLLKEHAIKMSLVTKSIVNHIECACSKDNDDKRYFQMDQSKIFESLKSRYRKDDTKII